jgi:hypothetical protein
MSPLHQNPELMAAIHTDRLRRLRQQGRTRRDTMRPDGYPNDSRWG